MNKGFTRRIPMLYLLLIMACGGKPADHMVYESNAGLPVLLMPDQPKSIEIKAKDLFVSSFKKITQKDIPVIREQQFKDTFLHVISIGQTKILQSLKPTPLKSAESYGILNKKNTTCIYSKGDVGLLYGVTQFFKQTAQAMYIDRQDLLLPAKASLQIPSGFELVSEPSFTYRESYFPQAEDYDYCLWNKTHKLEEYWGCWGHNLHRLIEKASGSAGGPAEIYALHNGERKSSQYCFSSPKLFELLFQGIKTKQMEQPDARYFSIIPNDNLIVCQCSACQKAGNSNTDAAPAVAQLVAQLAGRFPDLVFMMSSYGCTKNPPARSMPANSGVIISTIDYPKGQALRQAEQAELFKGLVSTWKQKVNHVFIWDYVVQYSNYLDLFPVLKSFQDNLKWYRELGVTGVFAHGSEDKYAALDDLKSYVTASLLWNPTQNIDSLRYSYLEAAYPEQFDLINDFYVLLEDKVYREQKKLDIYGNISEAIKAYLNEEALSIFFYDLSEKEKTLKGPAASRVGKLLTALCYDQLEALRYHGCSEKGYARVQSQGPWKIQAEGPKLVETLQQLMSKYQVSMYNEQGELLQNYLKQWEEYIFKYPYQNRLYASPLKILSESDEDFVKRAPTMLTDGALGFREYTMHWLLQSTEDLIVEANLQGKAAASKISCSFLNDPRHGIHFPEEVIVSNAADEKIIARQTLSADWSGEVTKREIVLNLPNPVQGAVRIHVVRTLVGESGEILPKSSIACDEICLY